MPASLIFDGIRRRWQQILERLLFRRGRIGRRYRIAHAYHVATLPALREERPHRCRQIVGAETRGRSAGIEQGGESGIILDRDRKIEDGRQRPREQPCYPSLLGKP